MIYSYINTRENWKNSKLCENTPPCGRRVSTQFLVFPISTRVDITVYQHGKCFIFLNSLLRLYIVEGVVLSCYQHFCLWLYAMILVLGDYENSLCQWLSRYQNIYIIHIGNFRSRLTLESWHTAEDRNADNNSKPLSRQYTVLTKKTYYHLIVFHSAHVYTSYLASFCTFTIYKYCKYTRWRLQTTDTRKNAQVVTSLQTSRNKPVHRLSTSCFRTVCSQFVVISLEQVVNNL